ncbi:MAG: aminomethyl transferase family protein [Anaerolineae bacterium]|nr:aminomethyl transferase family protein [Anaerolineae bacterium]
MGLGWTVKLDKPYFVGQAALRQEKTVGSKEKLVGLVVDVVALEELYGRFQMPLHLPAQSWNDGRPVYSDTGQNRWIGRATSGTWSPILKQYVVMARVQSAYAQPGTRLYLEETIESQRLPAPATVVKLPFFDPPRKKS